MKLELETEEFWVSGMTAAVVALIVTFGDCVKADAPPPSKTDPAIIEQPVEKIEA